MVERHSRLWAGAGCGREAYGDKGKVRKSFRGIRGHGQGHTVVRRHMRLQGDVGRLTEP